MSTIATICLIVTLLFGGTGATAYAAQNSLPDEPLYQVKQWSEEMRAGLTRQVDSKVDLAWQRAEERVREMTALAYQGDIPDEALVAQWQNQVALAFQLLASQPQNDLERGLVQARERLTNQLKLAECAGCGAEPARVLEQTRLMIRERIAQIDEGVVTPDVFRQRLRSGMPAGDPIDEPQTPPLKKATLPGNPWTTGTPTPGSGYGEGKGGNPWTDTTPTPGSGYGSGEGGNPWTTGTPTPGSGYGSGNGGNPWTDDQPTPGSGYGEGNGGTGGGDGAGQGDGPSGKGGGG